MALELPSKKFFKITGIVFGIILVLLTGFHFWFKAYAKRLIEDMVESNSHGKIKLQIGTFHFNYFNRQIQLDDAVFYNTDTATGSTAYRFSVKKIDIRTKAILPIIFQKRILIDSLKLSRPHIEVTRLRTVNKPDRKEKKDVSIPEEMGKVYTSIQDALAVLKVKRFVIEEGTFRLVNKIIPNQLPMEISNLYFQIDNLVVDSSNIKGKDKILFSDNVTLRSHDQDILFPDGRHRLSFSHFSINLQKKLVHFDSCTIAATRKDSANASFNVFFDALDLTNIDFDTLYKSEVIKADSVYCINPNFNLEVDAGKKKGAAKPAPKLENIIQQLTGDLLLKYVVVTNADFNIKTIKEGRPSTFTFSKNNFEMQGLSVDQGAAKPIKVKSFAMAIRNYENFIKDSSYSIRFDSVILKDDRITLSNFVFQKLENGKILNTFSIPQFNLQGLSWDDLVFERRLKAEQAFMFNPHISYTVSASNPGRQNIFVSLGIVNDYMDLQFLDIREGMIDLRLKNNVRVQLDNANVAVQSNSLLTSTKLSGIKNSLTNLNFKKGRVQAGDLLIELDDIRYAGPNGRFEAGNMHVKSDKKKMDISLHDVAIKKMLVDEITGSVFANDLNWQKADVVINTTGWAMENNKDASVIELSNVKGSNTSFRAIGGNTAISAKLDNLSFDELLKRPEAKLILKGLVTNGEQLNIKNNGIDLSVASFAINDNKSSSFRELHYKNNTGKTVTDISIPSFTLIPHIQPLINGAISFDAVGMEKPVIRIAIAAKNNDAGGATKNLPAIDIRGLKLIQPVIHFTEAKDSGMLAFDWYGNKDPSNYLQAGELHASPGKYRFNDLQFYLANLDLVNPKGRSFSTGNGKISAQINLFDLQEDEQGELEWDARITALDAKDFHLDNTGRAKGSFNMKSGSLENLAINSSTITNLRELAAANEHFRLKQFTGDYTDQEKQLRWYNAGFNRSGYILSADSFAFAHVLEKDPFMAKQSFQKDYINFRTGAIRAGPFDLDGYIKNNEIKIGTLLVDEFFLSDYKDKQLPFNPGIIKPLPVNMVKKISVPLSVDTIRLTNAGILYTERPEKTKSEGVIPITRMNARLMNVRNFNISPADSLQIEATGYLLDTAWIRLTVKESYTDSLGGFVMTAQARAADLQFLNPVLLPLAGAKIKSGMLDSLAVTAIGRDDLAWGEMQLFYHDLKVIILKKGEEKKNKFITWLVNMIVRNKNESRTGNVFFIRQRDRSAINYLVKIVMSGVSSSVGVKNNKKKAERYKQENEKKKPAEARD
ncbi:MAG TPA: hypothetical protein VGO58_11015 [Chitinophagaceae bacterium]|nr:hypothetical protein [Chitinophagaceae bacterium]